MSAVVKRKDLNLNYFLRNIIWARIQHCILYNILFKRINHHQSCPHTLIWQKMSFFQFPLWVFLPGSKIHSLWISSIKKKYTFFRGAIFYKDSQYPGLVLLNKRQLFRSIFNKNNLIRVTILNSSLLIPFSIFYLNH